MQLVERTVRGVLVVLRMLTSYSEEVKVMVAAREARGGQEVVLDPLTARLSCFKATRVDETSTSDLPTPLQPALKQSHPSSFPSSFLSSSSLAPPATGQKNVRTP